MIIGDPLLLLLDGEIGEELRAFVWTWRYVGDAPHELGDLEAKQAEGYVGKALPLLRKLGHIRAEVAVIDIERLLILVSA